METINNNLNDENYIIKTTHLNLKIIIFSMVFYIISNNFVTNFLKVKLPRTIDVNIVQTLLFALCFYLISEKI